jgi:molybdopterin-dependent oxidoreductase alpha subunit
MTRRRRSARELIHSLVPFGLNATKPRHFREMGRILWENRGNLPYAWKVLSKGVCDGCALGTSGLSDWTVSGTHLCLVRLNLLKLNTMAPLEPERLADLARLSGLDSKGLRDLGRLPVPMRRRRGEPGFTPIDYGTLWREVGAHFRGLDPRRVGLYLTSRGLTNENYYAAQKVWRAFGSNNLDNAARLCHSPSTNALKQAIGAAATTCSYVDWYDADLIVFLGSNPANDQPVAVKYLYEARRRGARVLMVNAYREPGMERYWIPSNLDSALFGTHLTDRFFMVRVGGDLAFVNAAAKRLIERGAIAKDFVEQATEGYGELQRELASQPLERLLAEAGLSAAELEAFVDELAAADKVVLVWSMGITQHMHGSDTVRAIANLGLLKEAVGRDGAGLMPIRGHSGVQGGAEMGAYATAFPGGLGIDAEQAARFASLWGFPVPSEPGLDTTEVLAAARRGEIDGYYVVGGNFLETLPDAEGVRAALARVPVRVHSDIVVTSQMLVEPGEAVYLLPAATRYEQAGGGTETSTERRVIFSPELPRKDLPQVRAEWQHLLEFARSVLPPERYARVHFPDAAAIRADIERAVPAYRGIAALSKQGDQFQIGGRHLIQGRRFLTQSGKARFAPVRPPGLQGQLPDDPRFPFVLATRRGKQFNSMVQAPVDQLTGAARDHVLIHPADAERLGLVQDQPIELERGRGRFRGRAFLAPVTPGTLQGFWPEVNPLLPIDRIDPDGGVPDYNARVAIHPR